LRGRRLVWVLIEEISMGVLTVPPNEVHRNEWGELTCNVYDEDNVFLYTEQIDEDIYKLNGAIVPVNWEKQQDNDFKELRI
jgi:hypothetical protein